MGPALAGRRPQRGHNTSRRVAGPTQTNTSEMDHAVPGSRREGGLSAITPFVDVAKLQTLRIKFSLES